MHKKKTPTEYSVGVTYYAINRLPASLYSYLASQWAHPEAYEQSYQQQAFQPHQSFVQTSQQP